MFSTSSCSELYPPQHAAARRDVPFDLELCIPDTPARLPMSPPPLVPPKPADKTFWSRTAFELRSADEPASEAAESFASARSYQIADSKQTAGDDYYRDLASTNFQSSAELHDQLGDDHNYRFRAAAALLYRATCYRHTKFDDPAYRHCLRSARAAYKRFAELIQTRTLSEELRPLVLRAFLLSANEYAHSLAGVAENEKAVRFIEEAICIAKTHRESFSNDDAELFRHLTRRLYFSHLEQTKGPVRSVVSAVVSFGAIISFGALPLIALFFGGFAFAPAQGSFEFAQDWTGVVRFFTLVAGCFSLVPCYIARTYKPHEYLPLTFFMLFLFPVSLLAPLPFIPAVLGPLLLLRFYLTRMRWPLQAFVSWVLAWRRIHEQADAFAAYLDETLPHAISRLFVEVKDGRPVLRPTTFVVFAGVMVTLDVPLETISVLIEVAELYSLRANPPPNKRQQQPPDILNLSTPSQGGRMWHSLLPRGDDVALCAC